MALVTCSECGKEISSEARTCPQCGKPATAAAAPAAAKTDSARSRVGFVVIMCSLATGCAAALVGTFSDAPGGVGAGTSGLILLGGGAVGFIASAATLRGSAIMRAGGGFLLGILVLFLATIGASFCRGVFVGGV